MNRMKKMKELRNRINESKIENGRMMNMSNQIKRVLNIMLVLLLSVSLVACTAEKKEEPKEEETFTIGVVQLIQHPALDATVEGLKDYLDEKGLLDKVVIDVQNAQGDPGIALTIAKQFANDDVDLIYAIATSAAQAAFNATMDKRIPVVFNAVTDPVAAGIAASLESSGNHVTGVSDAAPLDLQLQLIREILPDAKKIGMLYNLGEINGKIQVDQVSALAPAIGMEAVILGVSNPNEISAAASQLANEVDAFYNITDNMIVNATALIVDVANKAKLPVFAAEDGQMDQGLLAVDGLSYFNLGRQAGPLVEKILFEKTDPSMLKIETAKETQLKVSENVAEALGITLPKSVLDRVGE